jgi:enoyl-CoA hydratase/carnithine racemase
MIMASQAADADLALRMGLVQAVYPDDEFETKVMDFCRELAGQPREMMAIAKLTINLCADADAASCRKIERLGQSVLHLGDERLELQEAMNRKLSKPA